MVNQYVFPYGAGKLFGCLAAQGNSHGYHGKSDATTIDGQSYMPDYSVAS
jgi:hypothetical protein